MFTNDFFKEIDLLIDEKSLCVKAYTGMFEERLEENVFNENFSLGVQKKGVVGYPIFILRVIRDQAALVPGAILGPLFHRVYQTIGAGVLQIGHWIFVVLAIMQPWVTGHGENGGVPQPCTRSGR